MNVLFLQSGSNLAPKMQANAKVKHDGQHRDYMTDSPSNLNSDSHGSLVNIIFFSLLDSDWLKSVPINP